MRQRKEALFEPLEGNRDVELFNFLDLLEKISDTRAIARVHRILDPLVSRGVLLVYIERSAGACCAADLECEPMYCTGYWAYNHRRISSLYRP